MLTETCTSLIVAFIIGSIPFGWIIAKLWGVEDLRKVGSANIGATNVTRTAGKLAGALTFILDFGKGLLPMLYFSDAPLYVGLAAVVGHCYSPFLSFRGGKGVSTTLGVVLAYNLWLGATAIGVYVIGLLLTRVSALGSLFSMLTIFSGALLFAPHSRDKFAIAAIVAIVLTRHRENWNSMLKNAMIAAVIASIGLTLSTVQRAHAALKDFRERDVNTSVRPQRIAALMPNIAETIIELGAGSRLVAAPEYTRLSPELKKTVKILGPYNRISTEVVHAARPDLVIASMDGNDAAQVSQLERLGLRVITVNTLSLADIVRTTKLIGAVLGDADLTKIKKLELALAPTSAKKNAPTVFLQVGWEPLVTISKTTFIHQLLNLAGGTNVFAQASMTYPRPNPEEVIARNPDVIIICRLTDDGAEAERARKFWMRFKNLAAVKSGKVFVVSGDLLTKPGFSLLEGLKELRKIL